MYWHCFSRLLLLIPLFQCLLHGRDDAERQHYRLYAIQKIPSLKVLDYTKIKQSERERAQRLAASAAGAAMEADARVEAREAAAVAAAAQENNAYAYNGSNETHNTFEPGEGKSAEESFATQFTLEEKAKIREMVANAASAEDIDRIESLVKRGIFPGEMTNVGDIHRQQQQPVLPPPPPPPLQDEEASDALSGEKRPAEEGNEGAESKRQKSN
jgi:U2 small nuclear ribonucleoprotein A'